MFFWGHSVEKTSVYHTVNGSDHALFHTSKTAKMIKVINT